MNVFTNSFKHETGTWHYAYSEKGLTCVLNKPVEGERKYEDHYKHALIQALEGGAFTAPLDLSGTEFQRAVWVAISAVPYGRTITYTQLAQAAGKPDAIRAAASACGANPVPLAIPCHRILRTGGALGGFALGLDVKRRLLAYESGVAQIQHQRMQAA